MTKNMYIKPSVSVTEMLMVQTLCASGDAPGSTTFSPINTDATTDLQL